MGSERERQLEEFKTRHSGNNSLKYLEGKVITKAPNQDNEIHGLGIESNKGLVLLTVDGSLSIPSVAIKEGREVCCFYKDATPREKEYGGIIVALTMKTHGRFYEPAQQKAEQY